MARDLREDAAHAIVKGAFLEAARGHAPEWAPLIEADDRDRKARAWAAYVESNRRSRLRSQAWLGRALPDVRRG